MDTSNHSSKPVRRPAYCRIYNVTPAGSRLAQYLDYLQSRPVLQDLAFGDLVPDQPTREETLERLYEELDNALDDLHNARLDESFNKAREKVREIRARIYKLENGED